MIPGLLIGGVVDAFSNIIINERNGKRQKEMQLEQHKHEWNQADRGFKNRLALQWNELYHADKMRLGQELVAERMQASAHCHELEKMWAMHSHDQKMRVINAVVEQNIREAQYRHEAFIQGRELDLRKELAILNHQFKREELYQNVNLKQSDIWSNAHLQMNANGNKLVADLAQIYPGCPEFKQIAFAKLNQNMKNEQKMFDVVVPKHSIHSKPKLVAEKATKHTAKLTDGRQKDGFLSWMKEYGKDERGTSNEREEALKKAKIWCKQVAEQQRRDGQLVNADEIHKVYAKAYSLLY